MTIEGMTLEEVREVIKNRSGIAIECGDLKQIFGHNGMSGRGATGNFSLLAKATELSRVHIGKVLKGRVEPSHSTLIKLSEVTGVSIDSISRFIREQREQAT